MAELQATSRFRQAFFSIDAAFAFLTAISMFALFSAIAFSAARSAESQSEQAAMDNLALRLASYALDQSAKGTGEYASVNEIDLWKFGNIDWDSVHYRLGAKYMRLAVRDAYGSEIEGSGPIGTEGDEIHCAQRLAFITVSDVLLGERKEFVMLEACVS